MTAVAAECDAIRPMPNLTAVVGGVGPAASAAGAATALARDDYDLVVCAGIGGGFAALPVGAIAVASEIVFADLGAQAPDGFASASRLGFGTDSYAVAPRLAVELADCTGGHLGTVLTVATVTGTAARAAELAERFPLAVAEGMEGAGVAAAAALHGVPVAEIRAISNAAGPRDRASWRIPEALSALGSAIGSVAARG